MALKTNGNKLKTIFLFMPKGQVLYECTSNEYFVYLVHPSTSN